LLLNETDLLKLNEGLLDVVVYTLRNFFEVEGSVLFLQTCSCSEHHSHLDFEIPVTFGG
jgi:hypothetical protein